MEYLKKMLCVLLVVAWSNWSNAAPTSTANGPDDVRWKLVTGLETAYMFAEKLVSNPTILYDTGSWKHAGFRPLLTKVYVEFCIILCCIIAESTDP